MKRMNLREYLITCLIEECAELQQALTKCQRFGIENNNPSNGECNFQAVVREYADLVATFNMTAPHLLIDSKPNHYFISHKTQKLQKGIEYSWKLGVLDKEQE